MIHVVKEKHLNDFKLVHCVRAKDLFSRLGNRQPDISFESSVEPIPIYQSKIDSMQSMMDDYDRYLQEQANKETATNPDDSQNSTDNVAE